MSTGRPLGRPPAQQGQVRCEGYVRTDSAKPSYLTKETHRPRRRMRRKLDASNGPLPAPVQLTPSRTEMIAGSQSSTLPTQMFGQGLASFDAMRDIFESNSADTSGASSLPMTSSSLEFGTDEQPFIDTFSSVEDFELMDPENTTRDAAENSYNWVHSEVDDDIDDESREEGVSSYSVAARGQSTAALTDVLANITCQLAELRRYSWDSWDPQLMQAAQGDGLGSEMLSWRGRGSVEPSSWDRTLSVTMRFAMVLQAVAPPRSWAGATPPAYSPPTLSTTLLLLSAYVQIGELFDTVLCRIKHCLQEPSEGQEHPPLGLQAPAVPRLAVKQSVGLHILMTTQFFENQLHGIEQFLGIPADYRLWSTKETYGGILDQDQLSGLAQDVIRQTQEPFRSIRRGIDWIRECTTYITDDR